MTFSELYQAYKNTVYNLALQYVGNREDAEEITQDVFVKVHENLNRFRKDSDWRTWIYRISINHSLDFLKAKKRQKRSILSQILRLDDPDTRLEIPHFNHPGIELEQKEAIEFILSCFNHLPDNQRTVIILLKIENLPQPEVAKIMKTSSKAVESVFHRAKKNLEKLLSGSEGK